MAGLTFLQSVLLFVIPLVITVIAARGHLGVFSMLLAMLTAISLFLLLQMTTSR